MFQINAIREKDKNFSKVLKMKTIKVFVLVVFCVHCVSAYGRPKKGKFSVHKSKFKNMILINKSNLNLRNWILIFGCIFLFSLRFNDGADDDDDPDHCRRIRRSLRNKKTTTGGRRRSVRKCKNDSQEPWHHFQHSIQVWPILYIVIKFSGTVAAHSR